MAGLVEVDITKKLPATAVVGSVYKIEGNVKVFAAVGAPPFVYARARRKEWYKPEIAEETSYHRGWPVPITGGFTIGFQPEKDGNYKVAVLASPAPISLPLIGVFPTLFESDEMEVDVGKVSDYLTFLQPKINGTTFTKVHPGDEITIICSVKSKATTPITVTGKVSIYQGAFWSTPGDLVQELTVPQFTIAPNETVDIKVETTADSEITSKDIQLFLLQDSIEIDSQRFQDAYSVEKIKISDVVTKQSVVYNGNQININSGQPISVQITWKNIGTTSLTPRFRVDIQGTGAFDSPLEGQWVTSPAVDAGQVVTVNASSIPIPTDWQDGKTLHCYVMLEGVSGHWDTSSLLTVSKPPAGGIVKQSIVYNNGSASINSGQPIVVNITVKNTGTQALTGSFRVDIKGTGFADQPQEGPWVTSPSIGAGQIATIIVSSIPIPTDWQDGKTLHCYVMLEGVSGHWDESPILFIVVKVGVGAVTKLSVIYNSNQTNINSGWPINVLITWKNTGTGSIAPRFRVDIQGTGFGDQPQEGPWVTSPAGAPGQTVIVNASSIPIPTDWQNGKTLHAYIVLDGISGHWDTAANLFTVIKGGGAAPTLSASYSNGVLSYSFSGFQPNVTVKFSILPGGHFETTSDSTGSGSGSVFDNDPPGNYLLQAADSYGHSASASFTISGGGGTLSASYSNGLVSYSFSGFQPNATVTIRVLETGGYVTATADSAGAGSGAFNDNDPAGNYTLQAVDSYGHLATATFTISGGGGAATLTASHSNGVCSYSFSGFQPNATVTLTVTQTGGYVTKTANSTGSGSDAFNDADPAGTYTLRATDSYGHSATATFKIGG